MSLPNTRYGNTIYTLQDLITNPIGSKSHHKKKVSTISSDLAASVERKYGADSAPIIISLD